MLSASEMQELLAKADQAFLTESQARLSKGEEQYGALAFLSVDTLEEAMQEVLDLANYARFTYIKLFLLQEYIDKVQKEHPAVDNGGFVPMKDFLQ